MKKQFTTHTALLLLIGLLAMVPVTAQEAAEANLVDECVTDYDPEVDYFPEKVEFTDAENVSIAYFNNYKVLTVTDAFTDAEPFTYVLVQCGTPAPEAEDLPEDTQFIEVPAGDIIALQTTHLPQLDALGLVDNLVGVDSFFFLNTPSVREKIEDETLVEVGFGSSINVELVLELEPDIVMTSGFDPTTDAHPVLIEAGIFTALTAAWREPTPLARAEWIKYTGAFYNAEAAANDAYNEIVTAYNAAAELAADVPEDERPTVLWNTVFGESWSIPGDETYVGILTRDAGGIVALGDIAPDDSTQMSFETVYDSALNADVWITNAFGLFTLDDLLAQDERYADFEPLINGNIWNNDLDVNENGGNNYYELGVTNPHLILQDLVAVFHPELLPDHEFRFLRPLTAIEE